MAKMILVVLVATLVVGISSAENKPLRAMAVVNGPNGVYGHVSFSQNGCGESVFIEASIVGLLPGEHGFHIHETGDLSNGCLSTEGHYNPEKLEHGAPNDQIRHVGDLGNLRANEKGVAETKFPDQVINLAGPRSIIGRAVVVHSSVDDLGHSNHPDSKKTGNAGGRVGCGIIGIMDPSHDHEQCSESKNIGVNVRGQNMLSYVCSIIVLVHSIRI